MPGETDGERRPRYLQIADDLREAITGGTYPPGTQLPGHAALQERYGASLTTVREAITTLKAEGLVDARHGAGVFVRAFDRVRRHSVSRLAASGWGSGRSVWESDSVHRSLVVDQVEVTTGPVPADVAGILDLGGQSAVCRSRRFTLDGKPVMVAVSYLPEPLVRGSAITRPDTGPGGIYARLADLGHAPAHFTEEVISRMPSPDEVRRLRLPGGTPVLMVTRTARMADGRAVEVNSMVLDASAYVLIYDFDA